MAKMRLRALQASILCFKLWASCLDFNFMTWNRNSFLPDQIELKFLHLVTADDRRSVKMVNFFTIKQHKNNDPQKSICSHLVLRGNHFCFFCLCPKTHIWMGSKKTNKWSWKVECVGIKFEGFYISVFEDRIKAEVLITQAIWFMWKFSSLL